MYGIVVGFGEGKSLNIKELYLHRVLVYRVLIHALPFNINFYETILGNVIEGSSSIA